jgi:hypothetical protein
MAIKIWYIIIILLLDSVAFGQGQILKPSNYKTQDNIFGLPSPNTTINNPDPGGECWTFEKAKTKYGDSVYYFEESKNASWFRLNSKYAYGGDCRQTSQLSDKSITGNTATWVFDVDTSTSYIIYSYILTSANAAINCYYKVNGPDPLSPLDSFRYNFRLNNDPDFGKPLLLPGMNGLWVPLTIVNSEKGKKNLSITLGADSLTGESIIRADAIRILKSDINGPDLEFGRRIRSFDSLRVEENFGDVILNSELEKEIIIFNPGNKNLLISGIYFKYNTGCFTLNSKAPVIISPGEKDKIKINFIPKSEGEYRDTLIINSNDPFEPEAKLGVSGNGVNYFFILNAGDPLNPEPNFNAPYDNLNNEFRPVYTESPQKNNGEWTNSGSISPFSFPEPGTNKRSRVNISSSGLVWCEYKFYLEPGRDGDYILEYSGPYYSPSSLETFKCVVKTPSISDSSTALFTEELLGSCWKQIGYKWRINSGGPTTIRFYDNYDSLSLGQNYLRADLLRIRQYFVGTSLIISNPEPESYSIKQNYPNPFNPSTKIQFSVADYGKVCVKIYDLLGREICTLMNEDIKPGEYILSWNGKNNTGHQVCSGTYFCKIISSKFNKTIKMLMMK